MIEQKLRRAIRPIFGSLCLLAAGCQVGPAALQISHAAYNEAIQRTTAEQLLLNLVRLKYREQPVFLDVGSVSAQFVFDQSGEFAGTFNEDVGAQRGNPNVLRLGGRIGYTERPTITYVPLSGKDFVQRLLSPISVETIVLLTNSGWRIDRVLRLTVQEANGLDNARRASGPTPDSAPTFAAFNHAADLLRRLQANRQVYLEYDSRPIDVSGPIAAPAMTSEAMVRAADTGTRFRQTPDGTYVLTRDAPRLILRFASGGEESPEARELRELLHLAERSVYDLVPARRSRGGARDDHGLRTDIALDTRSLIGTMFFLSQGITAPQRHLADRLITQTTEANGTPFDWARLLGDLIRVHAQRTRPKDSAIAVRHRGYWFYLRDDDLNSKSTFSLLGQLFTLRAGGAAGVAPVLTLPVGG